MKNSKDIISDWRIEIKTIAEAIFANTEAYKATHYSFRVKCFLESMCFGKIELPCFLTESELELSIPQLNIPSIPLDVLAYFDIEEAKRANQCDDDRHQIDISTMAICEITITESGRAPQVRVTYIANTSTGNRYIYGKPGELVVKRASDYRLTEDDCCYVNTSYVGGFKVPW